MNDVTISESTTIEGGSKCQGIDIQLGDFHLCIGQMVQ